MKPLGRLLQTENHKNPYKNKNKKAIKPSKGPLEN